MARKAFISHHRSPTQFFDVVDTYLEDHKEDNTLIGVHCTHGVNRTGYLICRYLIERLGYSNCTAIEMVVRARGHHIEHPPYIWHLERRTPGSSHVYRRSKEIMEPRKPPPAVGGGNFDWRQKKEDPGKGKEPSKFQRGKMVGLRGDEVGKEKGRGRERDRPSTSQNIRMDVERNQDGWVSSLSSFMGDRKRSGDGSGVEGGFYGRSSENRRLDFSVPVERVKDDLSVKTHERYPTPSYYINPPSSERKSFPEYVPAPIKPYFKDPTYVPNTQYGRPSDIDRCRQFSAKECSPYREPDKRYPELGHPREKKLEDRNFSERQDLDFRDKFNAQGMPIPRASWDEREPHGSRSSFEYKERERPFKEHVSFERSDRKRHSEDDHEHDRSYWVSNKYSREADSRMKLVDSTFERFGKPRVNELRVKKDRSWEREDKTIPRDIREYEDREGRFEDDQYHRDLKHKRILLEDRRYPEEERSHVRVFDEDPPDHFEHRLSSEGGFSRSEEYDHRIRRGERMPDTIRGPFKGDDKFKGTRPYTSSYYPDRQDFNPRSEEFDHNPAPKSDTRGEHAPGNFRPHSSAPNAPYGRERSDRSRPSEEARPRVVRGQERFRSLDREYGRFGFSSGRRSEEFPEDVERTVRKSPVGRRLRSPLPPKINPSRIIKNKPTEDLREGIRRTREKPSSTGEVPSWSGRRRDSHTPPPRHALISVKGLDCRELINQKRSIHYDERGGSGEKLWPSWDGPREVVEKLSDNLPFNKQRLNNRIDISRKKPRRKELRGKKVFDRLDIRS